MTEAQRLALLSETYLFGVLPTDVRAALASTATLRHIRAGDAVLRQGETAGDVFVVVSGRGEESVQEQDQPVPVALVARGEVIGEEALRRPDRSYGSSVHALERMTVLAVPLGAVLREAGSGEFLVALDHDAETLDRVTFVKRATPFATLPPSAARQLATDLSLRRLEAGEHLVREGEYGDSCYLIRDGRFAVRRAAAATLDPAAEPVGILQRGELVGEVSLLAGEPHRASVVALEPGEVLVLRRSALMKALAASHELSDALTMRARLRVRPVRADGVERHELARPDGETITILKDPVRGAYFRLSELGGFVWDRLDGTRTIRTLVIEEMTQAHRFAPAAISELVAGLMTAGFARPHTDMASLGLSQPPDTAGAWAQGLRRVLVRTFAERDPVRANRAAERFCRWLAPLATRPAVVALAGISLAGLTLIIAAIIEVWGGRGSMPSWPLAVVFFAVGLLCHEVGHALAMKSFGRSVNGYGIGWHWFVPFAYVDTTDAWLGPPRARAAIALAGPFTNLVLASLAAFVGTAADGALVRDAAWVFAGANILLCLAALSPAGENDGAQALEEWLGPRSRRETSPFGSALATFGDLLAARTTRVAETGLAVALTLHAAVVAGTSFFVYRLLFERAVVQEVGEAISAPLGIVLAIAAAFLTVEGVTAASLRGRRRVREP